MRRVLSLRFDALEARKLLSAAQVAATKPAPAAPLNIDGTLAVDVNDASSSQNLDGSMTTSVPISGRLGALGKGFGFWNDTVDANGNYEGPDTLVIKFNNHLSKGTLTIAFNNQNTGKPRLMGHGLGYYQHPQEIESGAGEFAKASESGPIHVIVSTKNGAIEGLALGTATS